MICFCAVTESTDRSSVLLPKLVACCREPRLLSRKESGLDCPPALKLNGTRIICHSSHAPVAGEADLIDNIAHTTRRGTYIRCSGT